MGDAAYDSDPLRSAIAARGARAVIPKPFSGNQVSAQQTPLCRASSDRVLLLEIEALQARRYARRNEAKNYSAVVAIAATLLWLR
jgi:transposase